MGKYGKVDCSSEWLKLDWGKYYMMAVAQLGSMVNAGGRNLVSTSPGCLCRKVKDMGPFWASIIE